MRFQLMSLAVAGVLAFVTPGAAREKAPLLDTLRDLVSVESGSRDLDGLARLAELIAGRLRALGGEVELVDVGGAGMYRMEDTPERVGRAVRATFKGTGTRKILPIARIGEDQYKVALDLVHDRKRFIRWTEGDKHPAFLEVADAPAIRASGDFFARKVDSERTAALLDLLDEG